MYQKRLEYCRKKYMEMLKSANGKYWRVAVGVYGHLLRCKKAHSILKEKRGVKICKGLK